MDRRSIIYWCILIMCGIALIGVCYIGSTTTPANDVVETPKVEKLDFDPRKCSAAIVYYEPDGTPIRGLKMTDETFGFITSGYDGYDRERIRTQVNDAEISFTRHYTIYTPKFDYDIENGLIVGCLPHSK